VQAADLWADGPLVEVRFGLTAAAQDANDKVGAPSPLPMKATALLDTGASHSAVRSGLLSTLGLHPVGAITIATPSSNGVQCLTYAVRLTLPQGFIDTTVSEVPGLTGQNIDALIGRDVLRYGILIYQGPTSQFTLSF